MDLLGFEYIVKNTVFKLRNFLLDDNFMYTNQQLIHALANDNFVYKITTDNHDF